MESPYLKLIIVKGPRSGQTLEFKPGSKIRIGRVVRGNNVTINDNGISSKHLVIEFESGKWTIQDLDSSNGTFLNSEMLPPNTHVELHENDCVKIGDCTTISVKITMDGLDESVAKVRRNPRRQVNVPASASVIVTKGRKEADAESVENLAIEGGEVDYQNKLTKKGRAGRKNLQEMPPQSSEIQTEGKENLEVDVGEIDNQGKVMKKGRGRKKNLQEMLPKSGEIQTEGKENLELEGREIENESKVIKKGRGRRKNIQEMPPESSDVQIECKENLELMEVREVQAHGKEGLRAGGESFKHSEVQLGVKDVANLTVTASARVTRSRKNTANLELDCVKMVNESKITRKGRGRKPKLEEMPPQSCGVRSERKENMVPGEVFKNCEDQADDKENLGLGKASVKNCEVQADGNKNSQSDEARDGGDGKGSCDKVEDKVNSGVQEQVVDLENMTLGGWFDYMEVYLRKQITDFTEEMIEEMRRKADRVYKYMIEEKERKKKMGNIQEG